MKYTIPLLLAITVVVVAGCGGAAGTPATLPGQSAVDAQATLNAYQLQLQATAAVQAQQTAVAMRATADHEEMLRATDGAATVVAVTATTAAQQTVDALVVRQTEVAVQMAVDNATAAARATNVAATPTASAQQTADAQIAVNVALVQRDTQVKMEQEQRREETRLRWLPILYALGAIALLSIALAGLGFAGFVLWRAVQLQRRPVITMDNGMNLLQQSRGFLASPQLLTITGPRHALPPGRAASDTHQASSMSPEEPIVLPQVRHGHVMVAGETDAGKSSAARVLLAARRRVVVLDPHSVGSSDWGSAPVIGAGRDFEAIREYMAEMRRLLHERYEQRAAGQIEFDPLTVAVDEMPAIVGAIGRDIETVWREWLREGRKVSLFLMLCTQSTRVKTLGIEGERDLLENFSYVLVLGDLARQEYGPLVVGMERPAILRTRGRVRPVVIPQAPEGGAAQPFELPARARPQPLFVAPTPIYGRAEREPDPDNLSAADKERIVAAYQRTQNLAAVQREIFPSYGNSGGRAFYAIKDTLVEAQFLPPYRPGSNGSSGSSGLHVVGISN